MGIGGAPGFDVHRLVGLRVQTGIRGSVTARRLHEGCTCNARARPSWADLHHRAKPCPRRSQVSRPYASAIALIVLWFMTQLAQPDYYRDVQRGWIPTAPVFTQPALVPILSAS